MLIKKLLRRAIGVTLAAGTVTALPVVAPVQEAEADSGCYGASCNNLNPAGRCDSDAMTVGVFDVPHGRLELRYSPSCAANWGRYTPYKRDVLSLGKGKVQIWPRVTVWNPGEPSYNVAQTQLDPFKSWWTNMTDGTKVACTGVEVSIIVSGDTAYNSSDDYSFGWTWGPCY